jgi:hypothetical protein
VEALPRSLSVTEQPVAGTLLPKWALQLRIAESDRPVGRIQERASAWRVLLSPDSFLVQATAEGFRLELWRPPPLRGRVPSQFPLPPDQTAAISSMVVDLLDRGVLSVLPPPTQDPGNIAGAPALSDVEQMRTFRLSLRLYAPVFAVPKKGSVKMRPIYDARFLNRFIRYRKFKLEGLMIARDLVRKNDFFCKIDLKDAYFHMTVHPEHRRFLCFRWQGKDFAYNGIPFGVSSAPRLFTKLMRPVIGSLRSRGIRAVIYLDDILLLGRSSGEAEAAAETTASLLHSLGFLISWEKSVLQPTQQVEFLGVLVDSVAMEFRLSETKLAGLRTLARSFLREAEARGGLIRTRRLSQVIGSLTASMPAVQLTRLKTRSLHRCLRAALAGADPTDPTIYGTTTTLSAEAMVELRWWRDTLASWNGRSLVAQAPSPTETFASDASDLGWGMTRLIRASASQLSGRRDARGFWSELEQLLHNNPKELLGVAHGLQAWIQHLDLRNATVHVQTDNTTALSYIRKQGGRILEMGTVAERLWEWCLQRGIYLTASHVPGVQNVRADTLSRIRATPAECRLKDAFYRLLVKRRGPFTIDLFASRLNNRHTRYFSRFPDPLAAGVDALLQPWAQETAYCFPPFALIGRVLKKLELEGGRMLLVVPHWPTQPWWPILLSLAEEDPIPLPLQAIDNPAKSDALPPDSTSLSAWMLSAHGGRNGAMRQPQSSWR